MRLENESFLFSENVNLGAAYHDVVNKAKYHQLLDTVALQDVAQAHTYVVVQRAPSVHKFEDDLDYSVKKMLVAYCVDDSDELIICDAKFIKHKV